MLRVHNYALEIPWVQGRGTITACPKHGLNRTRGCRFFNFLLLSGLHSSEGLFGSSIAAQTMQEPGKQTSHAALWNSQVVSITSSIPVSHTIPQPAPGTDMLNSPTFCLSHYLYRSALIAALFNKQCIAFVSLCITFFYKYMLPNDMLHPYNLVRPKYARGF